MKLLVTIILLFFCLNSQAQPTCDWVRNEYSTPNQDANVMVQDKAGNIYMAGVYTGTLAIGTHVYTSLGEQDVYVAKYNSSGQPLWVKTGGSIAKETVGGIAIDTTGNIYVTGSFGAHTIYPTVYTDTAYFDNDTIMSKGQEDVFLAKYTNSGTLIWLRGYGSAYNDAGTSLVSNHAQKITLTGTFSSFGPTSPCHGVINFDNLSATSAGDGEIFIVSVDANGNAQWLEVYGGYDEASKSIQVDSNDNIYMTGYFYSHIYFGSHLITSISTGFVIGDIFVAKFNPIGQALWAKAIGGAGGSSSVGGAVEIYGMTVTESGNAYVTGSYSRCNCKIYGLSSLPYKDQFQVFLVRYTTDGVPVWARNMGGGSDSYSYALCSDKQEHVYVTGFFNGIGIFGTDTVAGYGGADAYIVKYDSAGNKVWLLDAGGNSYDAGYGITCNSDGSTLYLCGAYGSNMFHCGTQTATSNGGENFYIA